MILRLTAEQTALVSAATQPGAVLLARIVREMFALGNADTSGTPCVEFVPVAEAALDEIRPIVRKYQL